VKIEAPTNPKEDGKIFIRGETVFKGYYNLDAKTTEVLSEDGWYDSGTVLFSPPSSQTTQTTHRPNQLAEVLSVDGWWNGSGTE
jgi:non-ribosomal peptide synthetase component E (peptide arylation enzyme)